VFFLLESKLRSVNVWQLGQKLRDLSFLNLNAFL
jgi:hypothetical protein